MSGRNDVTRSGTCGTTCILDDVHYSICSLRTRPVQAGWRWKRLRRCTIAALYRTRVYQCGAPCTIHERFTQDSPAARNHASEGEEEVGDWTRSELPWLSSGMCATPGCRIVATAVNRLSWLMKTLVCPPR